MRKISKKTVRNKSVSNVLAYFQVYSGCNDYIKVSELRLGEN